MSGPLGDLAKDLEHAATSGSALAGTGAVQAGALQAEVGLRVPGIASSIAVSGVGGLQARVGATQRRGVYQEASPATAGSVSTAAVADTMADVAASLGAKAVQG